MVTAAPDRIRVRMYNVGFGDCFLVSFHYPAPVDGKDERHLLVDFGTKSGPPKPGPNAATIAQQVVADTGGAVDVVVVTHRHQDHLSAFDNKGTWETLAPLHPQRIIRPWPDHPDAGDSTTGPALDEASHAYARALAAGAGIAEELALLPGRSNSRRGALAATAADQISNKDALDRLLAWVPPAETAWVAAGSDCRTDDLLPGVTIRVLGPPTLAQVPGLKKQDEDIEDEYWMLYRAFAGLAEPLIGAAQARQPTPDAFAALAAPNGRGAARWLLERMGDNDIGSLMRIMTAFDDALNNTSVVLLVTAGERSMLFTGDAQFENWSWAVAEANAPTSAGRALRSALADIDLYKVGHHGSRNATPKSIYKLWTGERQANRPLVSLLSTKPGVYPNRGDGKGKPDWPTAVPRTTLSAALEQLSSATGGQLYRTDTLPPDQLCHDLTAATTGASAFAPTP